MTSSDEVRRAAEPLAADPSRTTLLFDFDGTLAPIVVDPAAAAPAPGVVGLLAALADRYRRVGIVSGRPIAFLAPLVPATVELWGQYGLEHRGVAGRPGGSVDLGADTADRWAPVVRRAVDALTGLPAGVEVEAKGGSLTVHHRQAPAAADAVAARVRAVAADCGLRIHAAKASIELRPPIDVDKGSVVEAAVADSVAALFVGDDLGDLPALRAIAAHRAGGAGRVGVAAVVEGPELPAEVRAAADLVLDGTDAVVHLLRTLAEAPALGERVSSDAARDHGERG